MTRRRITVRTAWVPQIYFYRVFYTTIVCGLSGRSTTYKINRCAYTYLRAACARVQAQGLRLRVVRTRMYVQGAFFRERDRDDERRLGCPEK